MLQLCLYTIDHTLDINLPLSFCPCRIILPILKTKEEKKKKKKRGEKNKKKDKRFILYINNDNLILEGVVVCYIETYFLKPASCEKQTSTLTSLDHVEYLKIT